MAIYPGTISQQVFQLWKEILGLAGFQVGNFLGAFQAEYVLMVIITGWLADRIGARRVVLAGNRVAACSTALYACTVPSLLTMAKTTNGR